MIPNPQFNHQPERCLHNGSENVNLAMSHAVSDLIQNVIKGLNPLHILGSGDQNRHYTYGGDLAEGVVLALQSPNAINESFNIATEKGHTVKKLATIVHDKPFEYDVQKRVPDVSKAKRLLGFDAQTTLEEALDEVIPWVRRQIKLGTI